MMQELVFGRIFLPSLERDPGRDCVRCGDYLASVESHGDRVLRLADAMGSELGLAKTKRYAVLAANSHMYLELYHAGLLGAGLMNPLNLRLAPAEVAYIMSDSESEVLFVDAAFAGVVEQVRAEVPSLRKVVAIGPGDFDHDVRYDDLLAAGEPRTPAEGDEADPAILMYTGGTTGLPKGVLTSQRAEVLNAYHASMTFALNPEDRCLLQTPMFHAAAIGIVVGTPAQIGCTTILPFFEPGAVLDAIENEGITFTVMVPTMIALTMSHEAYEPARMAGLAKLGYGAAPMPLGLLHRIQKELPDLDLYQAYGMTEAAVLLTVLSPDDHERGGELLRSAGVPVPGVVLSIQDPDGKLLPHGAEGEVCAKGGNFMDEYWNKPEATAEAFRGGWYHTGDMGRISETGHLYLIDRVKDMIVTGGENVYSIEVENAIATHPDVLQVAVIGIPHDTWGEQVHAIVVPQPGASPEADELIAHARTTIAGYKVPKSIDFRAEPLPMSGAMKPLKRELRKPYWEGADRGVN